MGQYVARKRAKFKGFSGPVNIRGGPSWRSRTAFFFGVELPSVG